MFIISSLLRAVGSSVNEVERCNAITNTQSHFTSPFPKKSQAKKRKLARQSHSHKGRRK